MKQLLILSGKGGTGKTTIASSFIKLSDVKAYADCDVDAPNLHLIMHQDTDAKFNDYYGMDKAQINNDICIECDKCKQNCRFDAIKNNNKYYEVDFFSCEGCGVCEFICPVNAISLKPSIAGNLILYENETVFSSAQLKMGSGTSGMLVTEVKKQMKSAAKDSLLAIIDGSPGIGCPVIASISGVDMVLIVAEPSLSGISDMKRIIETTNIFQTRSVVCINKYDTNIENSNEIEVFCKKNNIPFMGKIPFDFNAVKAINQGKTIVDIECVSSYAVKDIFVNTMKSILDNDFA